MDLDSGDIILACDRVGIIAFAFGGVEVGVRRRFDVFGLIVMGVVASTGGGLMRDVMIGRTPFVLQHADYLVLAVVASVLAVPFVASTSRLLRPALEVLGAAGLGAFAVAGAFAAIESDLPLPAVIVLAIITAVGGGVVRDLLADRIPNVLRVEVNATAAGIAGAVVWAIEPQSSGAAVIAGIVTAAAVRTVTLMLNINLPVPRRNFPPDTGPE